MWLKYGIRSDNVLVSIEEVPSGKTALTCLYCGGGLTAKKGKIKEHHFAHSGETCRQVARGEVPTLPLYDNFNIHLSASELSELKVFWKNYGIQNREIFVRPAFKLILSKLLVINERGLYEFTNLGKIPVGGLSLQLFNEVQEPLLVEKLTLLEQAAARAQLINARYLQERIADVRIYQAQLKRILESKLYFLEIKAGQKIFHKIGITKRSIGERVAEIHLDLANHYKHVEIQVLGTWEHRGNVELYFLHKYKEFNYKIGTLTEYFRFNNLELVLNDLQQMKSKTLAQFELDILAEHPKFSTEDQMYLVNF